ncbi:trd-1 [Pristionchus pacificus]|nr:trd-1 [Pristionchus pacificus]
MDRIATVSSEEELTALLVSLSESEKETLAEQLIDKCLAANCTGFVAATTSPFLESSGREQAAFGLNKPAAGARCVGAIVVLRRIFPEGDEGKATSQKGLLLHFRHLLLWQLLLIEPAADIKRRIENVISLISSLSSISTKERVSVHLEMYHTWMRYYEHEKASEALSSALSASGLQLELTGRMGKRTRFQQKELAQLVLDLTSSSAYGVLSPEEEDCDEESDVPLIVANQDDTLLQKVTLTDEDPTGPPPPLTSLHLALLLAAAEHERQNEHNPELRLEKCDAYLEQILIRRRCWSVQASALSLRAQLESSSKRRVERACQQMELLVHLQMGVEPSLSDPIRLVQRSQLCLAAGLAPVWKMRENHAKILTSLGCVPEALLIFESLEEWDRVVECFKRLGQLEKAEGLLRRLLEERGEDAEILCSLGDITNRREYYDRAIKSSSDRCAHAHRSLGMLFLNDRKYGEAYDHFKRSLELQPIQLGAWFNAGHCAWKQDRFAEAVSAYHRCTSLEPEHFEAWNNLAAAYIRMGQKERAARILFEALKYNYEHANVWENYFLLCVDTQNQRGALLALDRLADLKKKIEDDEAIEALCVQITLIEDDIIRKDMRETAAKTLGHLAACQQLSGRQWRAYARLRQPTSSGEGDAEKYTTLMEKATAAFSGVQNWHRESAPSLRVIDSALALARHRLECGEKAGTESALNQARVRVRMSLRQIVTMLEKTADEGLELEEDVQKGLTEAKELLATVV